MDLKVLTIGTFGVPHFGHFAFLQRCSELGIVIVGVNSDRFVLEYKGKAPLYSQDERMEIIAAAGYQTVLNDGPGRELIEEILPDVLTIGTDWARKDYYRQIDVDQDFMDRYGIIMAYVPMRPAGISTTDLLKRLDLRSE